MAGNNNSLTEAFTGAAKHLFAPTMIIMMTVMAFPAVAAAAPAGAATLGDLGMGLLDHYGTMFAAPFTETEMLGDVINNTMNGDLAASSYELGGTHHHGGGGHGGGEIVNHDAATGASADAGHGNHSSAPGTQTASAHIHPNECTVTGFNQWSGALSDSATSYYEQLSGGAGLQNYYMSSVCHAPTP